MFFLGIPGPKFTLGRTIHHPLRSQWVSLVLMYLQYLIPRINPYIACCFGIWDHSNRMTPTVGMIIACDVLFSGGTPLCCQTNPNYEIYPFPFIRLVVHPIDPVWCFGCSNCMFLVIGYATPSLYRARADEYPHHFPDYSDGKYHPLP